MPLLNPGGGWVSGLCAEPTVIQHVLRDMIAPHEQSGRLRILPHYRPVSADVTADRVGAVAFASAAGAEPLVVTAACVLDASEEGDVLPLTGCEHTLGAESVSDTGELHALHGPADPQDQHVAVDDDLEVVVGDPAAERLDLHGLSGPEPPDGLLDAHARS